MNITSIVVNYRTPDLLRDAVTSFKEHYPQVRMLIVDNGSDDEESMATANHLAASLPMTEVLALESNIYHGPAMDLAIRRIVDDYAFVLDSDTVTQKGGFLEEMLAAFEAEEKLYSIGATQVVDRRGFVAARGTTVVKTPAFLLRRSMYLQLPPFAHHGMPTLKNYRTAQQRGLRLYDFPIDDYVLHIGRGTCSRYGYGLGVSGKIDYLLHKLGL